MHGPAASGTAAIIAMRTIAMPVMAAVMMLQAVLTTSLANGHPSAAGLANWRGVLEGRLTFAVGSTSNDRTLCLAGTAAGNRTEPENIPSPPAGPHNGDSCPACQGTSSPLAILIGAIAVPAVPMRWRWQRWTSVTVAFLARPFRLYSPRAPPVKRFP